MKRITAVQVETAYRRCGLTPCQGDFYNAGQCCALTAVAIAEHGASEADLGELDDYGTPTVIAEMCGSHLYIEGFTRGFDEPQAPLPSASRGHSEEFINGQCDGTDAAIRMGLYTPSEVGR